MNLILCLTFMYFMLGLKDGRHSHLHHVFLKHGAVVNFPLYKTPPGIPDISLELCR